jgi:hypothetical protein
MLYVQISAHVQRLYSLCAFGGLVAHKQAQQVEVVAEDLLEFLGRAITCAILGKAGPQRSRVLGMLFKVSFEYFVVFTVHAVFSVVLVAVFGSAAFT